MGKVPHSVKAQVVTESGNVWSPAGYPRPPPVLVRRSEPVGRGGGSNRAFRRGGVFGKVWKAASDKAVVLL